MEHRETMESFRFNELQSYRGEVVHCETSLQCRVGAPSTSRSTDDAHWDLIRQRALERHVGSRELGVAMRSNPVPYLREIKSSGCFANRHGWVSRNLLHPPC